MHPCSTRYQTSCPFDNVDGDGESARDEWIRWSRLCRVAAWNAWSVRGNIGLLWNTDRVESTLIIDSGCDLSTFLQHVRAFERLNKSFDLDWTGRTSGLASLFLHAGAAV